MTTPIIITLCVAILIAYVFDLTAKRTRVPSVILLMALGFAIRQATSVLGISVPDLAPFLPFFGTVGLILIVMEGSLELEVDRSKLPFIGITMVAALVPLAVFSFGWAAVFASATGAPLWTALANAIPLAVISSAVAIPTAAAFSSRSREFVVYESSLSDIIGVIAFNFVTLNDNLSYGSVFEFFAELTTMLVLSFAASIALAALLGRIRHHVKYLPITVAVVLIYAVAKEFHLPALIFILIFGLFLGNLERIRGLPRLRFLELDSLEAETGRFHEMAREVTFLIRALFFLLFGFVIQPAELLDLTSLVWTLGIVASIYALRAITLLVLRQPLRPLLFVAPRGLITILLFLSIPAHQILPIANRSLVIQVIIACALVMMIGAVTAPSEAKDGTAID